MPPPTNRNVFVILVDLKTSSRSKIVDTLSTIRFYELLNQSKDFYKVYLVNSGQSTNLFDYQGISLFDFEGNDATLSELPTDVGNSDFFEALRVAVDDLKNSSTTTNSKVITLKILFLTDLCSFKNIQDNGEKIKVIEDLKTLDVFVYIVGVDVEPPPKTIVTGDDVKVWMKHLDTTQNNLVLVKDILSDVPHAVVCNYGVGLHLFYSYSYFKARQPWNVPLSIGPNFDVPVSTIKITEANAALNLKNTAKKEFDLWCYEDEQDKTLDTHDTVSGLIKHGKFVKIETDGSFKVIGPRSFRLLMITSEETVPEYLLDGEESYVVLPPEDESESYYTFFNSFVDELACQKLYVIARRVYNKDFNPQFVALIPKTDMNQKCFTMCQLPYGDDIRHPYKEKPVKSAPKAEVKKDVYNFLDSINVNSDQCKQRVPLAPQMMLYPDGLSIINKVKEKLNIISEDTKPTVLAFHQTNVDKLKQEWSERLYDKIKFEDESNLADFDDIDDFTFE